MNLLDLPNEILPLFPLYIDNIETFTSAASSCWRPRENFVRTHPKTGLLLAEASAPTAPILPDHWHGTADQQLGVGK